ncbi:hypothetical protein BIW11_03496 [Tropilaelaps mercedesae]|uniref:Uncharacterized protein n=1 Tax=Tropilaelaps mercedesae TaxID=418985 RepID=A0A1V9XKI7_9ACAR|nr:hypothetical protein BIW11_03496 [Tropilaelaps mercedesae]
MGGMNSTSVSDLSARIQAIHAALDELVQQGVVGVTMGGAAGMASEKITAIHMARLRITRRWVTITPLTRPPVIQHT